MWHSQVVSRGADPSTAGHLVLSGPQWLMLPSYQAFNSLHLSATVPSQPKMAENCVVGQRRLCCTLGYRLHTFLYITMRPGRLLLDEGLHCCQD